MMKLLSVLEWTSVTLIIIGAVNWGLVGFFGFDLVATIFGEMSFISRAIYSIVGLAGVYLALDLLMAGGKQAVPVKTGAAA